MCFLQLSLDSLPKETKKLYLAFSGGIDSTVLLHALQPHQQHYQIIVWHINHGLQGSANSMQEFARQQANQYGLEFRLDNLNMDPLAGNLEAKARDHRYRLFENVLCLF